MGINSKVSSRNPNSHNSIWVIILSETGRPNKEIMPMRSSSITGREPQSIKQDKGMAMTYVKKLCNYLCQQWFVIKYWSLLFDLWPFQNALVLMCINHVSPAHLFWHVLERLAASFVRFIRVSIEELCSRVGLERQRIKCDISDNLCCQ